MAYLNLNYYRPKNKAIPNFTHATYGTIPQLLTKRTEQLKYLLDFLKNDLQHDSFGGMQARGI